MFLGDDNEKLRTFRVSTDVARMNEYIKLQTSQIVNLCKVFESIVREKGLMGEHLEVHKLTEGTQHGFVKNKFCLTNLLVFMEAVTNYLDSGYPVDVI